MSRTTIQGIAAVAVIGAFIVVLICLNSLDGSHALEDALNQRPDVDVTTSTNYHFASFAGTTWITKTETPVVEVKSDRGKQTVFMVPPRALDPTSPMFIAIQGAKVLSILPVGTKISIERLMEDRGARGGFYVCCRVIGGTNNPAMVQMSPFFFAPNRYLYQSSSTKWSVNPVLLERGI
jgi:hypothetical protein